MNEREETVTTQLTTVERNRMILEFYPLVKSIAYRLVSRYPSNIDVDDLINVGTLGLIDATDKFNPDRQDSFKTYAETRIRGAIIDELRQQDWVPRSVRQRQGDLERALRTLESTLGRKPTDGEVATYMNITINEFHQLARNAHMNAMVSLEDLGLQDENKRDILQVLRGENDDPDFIYEAKNATDKLTSAIDALPKKERNVIALYYYHELTLKEIGQVLGVTESRVSQIHSQAVDRLKKKLKKLAFN